MNKVSFKERALLLKNELIEVRRTLHQYPELSFQEFETSKLVVEKLAKMNGMKMDQGIGYKTAVIGTLSNGEGPTIAVRADMDALPITEDNDVHYRSTVTGVMHACGHDAHTSICLGVAKIFANLMEEGSFQGTVKFIFQPAEENTDRYGKTGAPYLVDAGVLTEVDAVIALHVAPENKLGEVLVHDGYSMANVDVFEATISGTGGHGAYPHLGTDPIWMLGPVMQAIHGIVARQTNPLEPAVISIGEVRAGSANNVIPSEVYLQGTLRSYCPTVREQLITKLEKAISIAEALGGKYTFSATKGEPALDNNPIVNNALREAITKLYPEFRIINKPFGLGGEDFSHMTNVVPGAMIFLGCAKEDGMKRELHTPIFDIEEDCLTVGTAIIAQTVFNFLTGTSALPVKKEEAGGFV